MRTLQSVEDLDDLPVGAVIAELTEPDSPAVACRGLRGWQFLGKADATIRYTSDAIWPGAESTSRLTVLYDPRTI